MENQEKFKVGDEVTLANTDRPKMIIGGFILYRVGKKAVCYYPNVVSGQIEEVEIFISALKLTS